METETGRQRKPGTDRDKQTHIQTKAKNDGGIKQGIYDNCGINS